MNDKVENLILEHLRAIRGDMKSMATDVDVLKAEVISIRQLIAGSLSHQNVQDVKIAAQDERLAHIEQRLELADD